MNPQEGTKMEIKHKQDYARCSGVDCVKSEECKRRRAYEEAQDLNLAYGLYVESKYCIDEEYKLFDKVK